jgi:pimeloyl-ACP methyl ester carboxylesterase
MRGSSSVRSISIRPTHKYFTIFVTLLFVLTFASPVQSIENQARDKSPEKKIKGTIVMIHGMFVGSWVWENFKKYFEERGYKCITPTLRYHDTPLSSPANPNLGTTSIVDYVNDIEKEIRKIEETPIIIGHSMGGLISQILASRGLVKSAVLIAPAAPRGINAATWTVIKSAWYNRERMALWDEPLFPTFEGVAYSSLHLLKPQEQKMVYEKFSYESGRAAWEMAFWFFDGKRATFVDDEKVTCPVLIIVGTEDRLTPPAITRKIQHKYNKVSTYIEFNNHSHWIIGEDGWEKVAETIHGWLARVP